jgi:tetratricopeptide (TPR) repeat protein
MIQNSGSTQPSKPVQKSGRGRSFLFTTLIVLALIVVTLLAGYQSGISVRKQNQSTVVTQQLTEQFQFVDEDIQAGRYEIAKQRLEFIMAHDPSFPGVQEKLTEVLVQINLSGNIKSPTSTPSPVPTADFTSAQQAYDRAAQLITAQDWPNALAALDQMRKLDPNYQQSQVDGMYYFALRNYGYDLIIKQGNLEGGIYQLTLAERFGPLDRDTNGLREGARVYIIGASFWELDWVQALFYFEQARNWGNLWDGTMTATERYYVASMRYGDELFAQGKYCEEEEALVYYGNAQTIAALDKVAQQNYDAAMLICFPATPTFDPASLITPTLEITVTPGAPTATSETPTETPTTPAP